MPTFTALPIPQTLYLDAHTRHFFPHAEHSAPVAAYFLLDTPAFKDVVFIGRIARFCTGALHLIVQEFRGDEEVDANAPCLMSALAMPFHSTDPKDRLALTRSYFAQDLHYPDAQFVRDWRDRVPKLRDANRAVGFDRLHFDVATGLGFRFREDGCNILAQFEQHLSSFVSTMVFIRK